MASSLDVVDVVVVSLLTQSPPRIRKQQVRIPGILNASTTLDSIHSFISVVRRVCWGTSSTSRRSCNVSFSLCRCVASQAKSPLDYRCVGRADERSVIVHIFSSFRATPSLMNN